MTAAEVAQQLPEPEALRRLHQSLATLEMVICPEKEYRYYSHNQHWGEGEELSSMENGSGDEYSIVYSDRGTFLRAFDHESLFSPYAQDPHALYPGLLDGLPSELAGAATEAAFSDLGALRATTVLWHLPGDVSWSHGTLPPPGGEVDGSELLAEIPRSPEEYVAYANEYHEVELPLEAVRAVYDHEPLTQVVVAALNPDATLKSLVGDLEEIGYPVAARNETRGAGGGGYWARSWARFRASSG